MDLGNKSEDKRSKLRVHCLGIFFEDDCLLVGTRTSLFGPGRSDPVGVHNEMCRQCGNLGP